MDASAGILAFVSLIARAAVLLVNFTRGAGERVHRYGVDVRCDTKPVPTLLAGPQRAPLPEHKSHLHRALLP
jgi:hypothetical protein